MTSPRPARLAVLGPVVLTTAAGSVPLQPLERDLLVTLHLGGADGEPAGSLQRLLWPTQTVKKGSYPMLVHRLRSTLVRHGIGPADPLPTAGGLRRLDLGTVASDLAEFRADVERARRARALADDDEAIGALRSALARWRGEPLQDAAAAVRARFVADLEAERLDAQLDLADLELATGAQVTVTGPLRAAVGERPADQRVAVRLAAGLHRNGDTTGALRVIADVERALRDEGLDLDPEVVGLRRELLGGAGGAALVPPPPRPPAQLLCRDDDVAAILGALVDGGAVRDGVVVQVSGPPGVGKTAVVRTVAERLAALVPDRPYLDLRTPAGRATGHDVLGLLARLLHPYGPIPDDAAHREALVRSLVGRRPMVLILDNVEDEEQVEAVLRVRWAAVLLVSRSPLDVPDLVRHTVRPLTDRASVEVLRRLVPDQVAADPEGTRRVARWCDGLAQSLWPMAARLQDPGWSPSRLADRLADEATRLTVLDPANRRLRASFAVACEGLSDAAVDAFEHLGLLGPAVPTAWSVAALADVPERAAEDALDELTRASLLDTWQRPGGAMRRYRLHDLLRLYAAERFAARTDATAGAAAAVGRLAGGYLHRARRAEVALHRQGVHPCGPPSDRTVGAAGPDGLRRLDEDRRLAGDAVRLAVQHGRPEVAAELGRALMATFEAGSHYERWRIVGEQALAAATDPGVRSALRAGLGTLRFFLDDLDGAEERLTEAIAGAGDEVAAAYAGLLLDMTLRAAGRPTTAPSEQALEVARRTGDLVLEVQALRCLAWHDRDDGRYAEGLARLDAAAGLTDAIDGPPRLLGYVLRDMGVLRTSAGDVTGAEVDLTRAGEIFAELGDRYWTALTLLRRAELAAAQDHDRPATDRLEECAALSRALHDRGLEASALRVHAEVDGRHGRRADGLDRVRRALELGPANNRQRAFALVVLAELTEPDDPVAARCGYAEALELLVTGPAAWRERAAAGLRRTGPA